ncbi:conserved domain protein [Megasphaera sp. UPII 135-E]|nr:conserved domain protein [Megasphaera sp. UPII 135-E]
MYPVDLMIGMMKDMRFNTPHIYQQVLNEESFVNLYFKAYCQV